MNLKHTTLGVVLFFFFNLGCAQIPEIVKKEIQYRVKNGINPSIAVGLMDSTGTHYYVHGFKDLAQKLKADENTLYEIGSITKTYTGLLLAKGVTEKRIQLNDPANNFLPDSIKLTDKKGTDVTLQSLSTHSSGLPRLPDNLNPKNQMDPYADYGRKDMFTFLSHYIPKTVDKNFSYSNLGAGLLGEILAIERKESFSTALYNEILTPLGLQTTFLKVPEVQKNNLAKGYVANQEVHHWHFKAMAAAGGLKTNIKDLTKYGKSYLKDNKLAEAQKLATTNKFTDPEGQMHGLGWFINKDQVIFHGGGTGGFRTFLAVDKKNKRVIAVMTNSGSSPAEDIAEYLVDPKSNPLEVAKEEVAISTEELLEFEGNYVNDGLQFSYDFIMKEDTLQAQLKGQPEFPVFYQGNDTFIYKVVKAKVVFERDENDTIVGLTLYQNGQEIPFIKTTP
ncbi:serine hydrolase [Galbibacter sp. BG1]|uniref:serine hydrolase domain-containing protein n=1 Tax=Galbibacter sp. BG1 TaxID=1170699 RepID=UPI0015B827A0|nr:serine hydrolase domain-containing protein [Galbibacter sp. BG1]QLE01832.1 serine hydrolase [Galbibacter sp. BG1]